MTEDYSNLYPTPPDTEEDDYIDDDTENSGEDVNYDDEIAAYAPTTSDYINVDFYLDGVKLASYGYTEDCHGGGETTIVSIDGQTVTATRGYVIVSTTYTGESYTFTYPRPIESVITIDGGGIYATSHFDSLIIPMTSKDGVFLNTGGSYNDKNIIINPRMESVTVTPTIKEQIVTPTDGKAGIETVTVEAISPDELIIDVDELPTSDVATNTYYRMGGALYRYGLLNTRWVLNEELDYSGLETGHAYRIKGSVLGNSSLAMSNIRLSSRYGLFIDINTTGTTYKSYSYRYYGSTNSSTAVPGGSYSYINYYNGSMYSYIGSYSKTSDTGVSLRTLDITGGDDIYDQTLVDWFVSNATLTSGSMWTKYLVPVPEGTQTITENGTYDISEKASVEVNVPSEEPKIEALSITENGTYTATDIDGYSPITVDVHDVIEIATETEMTSALDTAVVGSLYKYTGETTATYTQNAIYIVEEVS